MYSNRKCTPKDTQAHHEATHIAFEPMVLEAQGGIAPRAAAILHRVAECAEGGDANKLKTEFLQRMIAGASARAMCRRRPTSAAVLKESAPME